MMNNQVEKEIIEHVREWEDHNIVTWDSKKENIIYFTSQ